MVRSYRKLALVSVALVLVVAGCGSDEEPTVGGSEPTATTTGGEAPAGSLQASDQTSDGKTIVVASVTIEGAKGFIALHQDLNGGAGPTVGHSDLFPEGTTRSVRVTADGTLTTGDYWPMLHYDANGNGVYEFPGPDAPVTANGKPVMMKIHVTVR